MRAAEPGAVIALGRERGVYRALVATYEQSERVFHGWHPTRGWNVRLEEATGPVVSISWTCPGYPIVANLRHGARQRMGQKASDARTFGLDGCVVST